MALKKKKISYKEACVKLEDSPANMSGYDKYLSHAVAVFTTSVTMVRRMRMTAPRRNRLNAHGNELQAAKKVALELLALCKETVIPLLGRWNLQPLHQRPCLGAEQASAATVVQAHPHCDQQCVQDFPDEPMLRGAPTRAAKSRAQAGSVEIVPIMSKAMES